MKLRGKLMVTYALQDLTNVDLRVQAVAEAFQSIRVRLILSAFIGRHSFVVSPVHQVQWLGNSVAPAS